MRLVSRFEVHALGHAGGEGGVVAVCAARAPEYPGRAVGGVDPASLALGHRVFLGGVGEGVELEQGVVLGFFQFLTGGRGVLVCSVGTLTGRRRIYRGRPCGRRGLRRGRRGWRRRRVRTASHEGSLSSFSAWSRALAGVEDFLVGRHLDLNAAAFDDAPDDVLDAVGIDAAFEHSMTAGQDRCPGGGGLGSCRVRKEGVPPAGRMPRRAGSSWR